MQMHDSSNPMRSPYAPVPVVFKKTALQLLLQAGPGTMRCDDGGVEGKGKGSRGGGEGG